MLTRRARGLRFWFDVANSPSLQPEQSGLVLRRLKTRIGKNGVSRVISQQTRSQGANKELTIERFAELVRDALRQAPIRKKTPVGKGAKLRRLVEKKQRSILKIERSKKVPVANQAKRPFFPVILINV
jgi:ribosome-associated protein